MTALGLHASVACERVPLLIVGDDIANAQALSQALSLLAPGVDPHIEHTIMGALDLVHTESLGGIIVDMSGGVGIEVLEHAVTAYPRPCLLALSGNGMAFATRVEALGVPFKESPLTADDLRAFLHRSVTSWSDARRQVLMAIDGLSARCDLTPTQAAVAYHLARGRHTRQIATRLKVTVHTVGDHLAALREKLHVHAQHAIVARVVAELAGRFGLS